MKVDTSKVNQMNIRDYLSKLQNAIKVVYSSKGFLEVTRPDTARQVSRYLTLKVEVVDKSKVEAIKKVTKEIAHTAGIDARELECSVKKGNIVYSCRLPKELWKTLLMVDDPNNIGKTEHGEAVDFKLLDSNPHCIICGATGSGKSKLMETIAYRLCMTHSSDELGLMVIDSHRDFEHFRQLPHLMKIAHHKESIGQLFADVQKIYEARKQNNDRDSKKIVVFADELVSPVVLGSKGNHTENMQIAQVLSAEARKFGIHLLMGTQHPNHSDLPVLLKNTSYRFIGLVSDAKTSQHALERNGAENLSGYGDFIRKLNGTETHFQAYLVEPKDREELAKKCQK